MWKKILIFQHKLSNYNHQGFIINCKDNKIVNLVDNYSIMLPFKLCIYENLYQYELLFTDKTINVNMMLNLKYIKSLICCNSKIPFKNDLFNILNHSKNNINFKTKIDSIKFNTLPKLENIIQNYNYIRYTRENVTRLKEVEFNLIEETISINLKKQFRHINIFFLFCNNITDNISNLDKLCIIDDENNYPNFDGLIINKKTFKKIKINTLKLFNNILIDRSFFYSRTYTNTYKEFHTLHNSIHAFNNYQSYISKIDTDIHFFNVELLNCYDIIFNDIDLKKIQQHPIRFSKNTKIFNFTYINDSLAESCFNYLLYYSKLRYNQICELEYWPYHPFYLPKKLLTYIHNINKLSIKTHKSDTQLSYELIKNSNNGFCDVYKTAINDTSYYQFNCGHKFMIDNFNHFNKNYIGCFTCQTPITSIKNHINKNTAIYDLLGKDFKNIFNPDYIFYFLDFPNKNKINFLTKIYFNIKSINKYQLINDNLENNSILCVNASLSDFEIINMLKSKNITNDFFRIIKLSQSI